jgi:hypothetical protein
MQYNPSVVLLGEHEEYPMPKSVGGQKQKKNIKSTKKPTIRLKKTVKFSG